MLCRLLLFTLLLIQSSCSSLNPYGPTSSDEAINDKPDMPFTLNISDEVNDGDRLHILGTVSAATDWSLKDVIVKLSSLSNGQPLGISYLPLTQAKNKLKSSIKANEKYSFTISVPSKDITDYQLELLWGEEAKHYLSSVLGQASGLLEVRSIQIETIRQPCDGSNCKLTFRASAKLHNSTNKTVNTVILGIGYIRIKPGLELDLQRQIPQNEDKIDVGDILLQPGSSRDIVINFDQEVPENELVNQDGELKPNIRILTFNTEQ